MPPLEFVILQFHHLLQCSIYFTAVRPFPCSNLNLSTCKALHSLLEWNSIFSRVSELSDVEICVELKFSNNSGLKVVLFFPTFPTFLPCPYFFLLFFLKYSYYSYFLNKTKIKNVYVSLFPEENLLQDIRTQGIY